MDITQPCTRLWATLEQLLWPSLCVSCGADAQGPLCALCRLTCTPHNGARCRRCDDASQGRLCRRCSTRRQAGITRARGVWRYEGAIKRAILAGKNDGHEAIWPHLAATVAQDPHARALASQACALVPIALSAQRRWQRGYNPSALMARALGRAWGKPVRHLLRRQGPSRPPQSRLDAKARQQGMAHAFAITGGNEDLRGARLVLVDDVITTCATLHAAAGVLLAHGAQEVWAISVARQVLPVTEHGARATNRL